MLPDQLWSVAENIAELWRRMIRLSEASRSGLPSTSRTLGMSRNVWPPSRLMSRSVIISDPSSKTGMPSAAATRAPPTSR